MAKTKTQDSTDAQDVTKKQRKQQAKQEARLMLKLEQAHRSVQKAEQKAAKAHSRLEANEKFVQEVEQQLTQLRGTQPETPDTSGAQQEPTAVDSGDQPDVATTPNLEASVPPVEGREDLSIPQDNQATPATDEASASEVETSQGGVPLQTNEAREANHVIVENIAEALIEDIAPINSEQAAPVVDEEHRTVAEE